MVNYAVQCVMRWCARGKFSAVGEDSIKMRGGRWAESHLPRGPSWSPTPGLLPHNCEMCLRETDISKIVLPQGNILIFKREVQGTSVLYCDTSLTQNFQAYKHCTTHRARHSHRLVSQLTCLRRMLQRGATSGVGTFKIN